MDLLYFLLGGALLAALVRGWRPEVSWRVAAAYLLATAAFFAVPLATPGLQVATDIVYQWRPWSETVVGEVTPRNPTLSDVPFQMVPFRHLVRQRLLRLEAPLWVHEIGTGQPLLGNAQSAPFAPLHLMALPLPALRSLTVAVAWQTLLALLLMHALMRALGAGAAGAAFAALAFSFSTFAVAWAYHPHAMVAAWIPGVLLGLVLLRRGERGGFAGLVACGLGMAASGHPETMAHTALACVPVVLALLVSPHPLTPSPGGRGGKYGRTRFLVRLTAAAALTACLAAPVLLPVLEALPESERRIQVERAPRSIDPRPFERQFLAILIDPLVFGSPRDGNWSGPANFNEMCTAYAGLLALALATAGTVLGGRRWLILLGGLAALGVALNIPALFQAFDSIPGLEHGAHARLRLIWILALAVLAGLSLERLPQERRGIAASMAAVAAAGLLLAFLPPPAVFWQQAWWWGTLGGVAISLLALAVPRLRPAFPWVAVGCLGLDLVLLGIRYQPVVPRSFDLAPAPVVTFMAQEARASAEPFRVIAETNDLVPNVAAMYGLWDPRGYDPMRPAGAAYMVGRSFLPRYRIGRPVRLRGRRFPAHLKPTFDYLGVRYLLAQHRRRLPKPWERSLNHTGGRVWRNPDALPLFFMPQGARRVGDHDEAVELSLANRDFAALGVSEGAPGSRPRPQQGKVRLARVLPNGFDLEVVTPTGGLVVSSVSHASGWRLDLDGQEAGVRRVNGGFLGFEVPPGAHRARLDYRPKSWIWGLRLFGLGIVGIAAALSIRLVIVGKGYRIDSSG